MSGSSGTSGGRYRFLRTRHWLGVIAIGIGVSLACTALGLWQWNRHTERARAAATVAANYDAEPVPLTTLLTGPGASLSEDDIWRPVTAGGTYVGGTVLLRNRPVAGSPALHVLAPLVVSTADGGQAVLVVDRGWVPAGTEEAPGEVPAPPAGQVSVVARLRAPEPAVGRRAPDGQVYTVEPTSVVAASAIPEDVRRLPVLASYAVLAEEDPAPDVATAPLPRPDTDLGTHLSYTFQWWVFAIGALVGVGVLARREAHREAPHEAGTGAGSEARTTRAPVVAPPRRARRRTAEEEEDALIAAQLAGLNSRARRGGERGDPAGSEFPAPP